MNKLLNHKYKLIALVILIILVGFGIYRNPDRKSSKANGELQLLLNDAQSTTQNTVKVVTDNKSCFDIESKELSANDCVNNLSSVKDSLLMKDQENITKLESYYKLNGKNLDSETKGYMENSIKLYRSNEYSKLMNEYYKYFSVYIDWHTYIRDTVQAVGVDNMSDAELIQAKVIAQQIVDSEDSLKTAKESFLNFLNTNFPKNFIDIATGQAS